ncbi:MAG: hypothetical protein K6G80_04300 [Treponema sp.]|nr:hypothetical protein [Treponema sp.]
MVLSCRRSSVVSVGENELFTLSYGSFEDELNLFTLSGTGTVNTYMAMRDGFFYIANGESKKIMELNSYGDLLSLYYNEEVTKAPSFAERNAVNAAKKAVAYPFNTLGPIAVDSRKYLYAVDTLPQSRQEHDAGKRLLLNNVVLRFSSDGNFIDYLGQQGPGGTPFPFIKDIYTTRTNELVVVCTTNDGPVVYWFNTDGFLLYTVPITNATVPLPEHDEEEGEYYVSVENVIPDTQSRRLFLKIDYFATTLDPALKVASGVEYARTLLCPLDVATGRYEQSLEIPPYEEAVSEKLNKSVYLIPFDFLGVTDSGWLFFSVPTERGYMIQMVQPNGQRILKRRLPVDHSEILYYSLELSGNGIVSALFAKRDHAEVAWWRTDSLLASFMGD